MTTDDNVIRLSEPSPGLPEILKMLDGLRHRAFNGEIIGLALVEHLECGEVSVHICHPATSYHHMTSGAAQLMHSLMTSATESTS